MRRRAYVAILLIFMVLLIISGCATNPVNVTYYSDPPGAAIYEGQRVFGFTPVNVPVIIPPELKNSRFIRLNRTKAIWASGVTSSVDSLTLDLQTNTNFYFTFVRPDVPGRDIDLNFALQLERNRIMQQQANAQSSQAFFQMYGAMMNNYNQPYNNSLNCTSNVVGSYIYTNCQ